VTNTLGKKHFEGEKIDFGSQFQRFQFTVSWLCCFWVVQKLNIMVGGYGGADLPFSWHPGSREKRACAAFFSSFSPFIPWWWWD
jgi:hypothetical protein